MPCNYIYIIDSKVTFEYFQCIYLTITLVSTAFVTDCGQLSYMLFESLKYKSHHSVKSKN